ncbi:unnamed protein product [Dicrocoelium dendriticum]|nr:unnamed protein product [Dicrocoelium dendriticum]
MSFVIALVKFCYCLSLLEEMKERVRNLADAFKLATEQRGEKVQMETVDKNGRLSRQLSLMGTGVLTVLDKNKSLQAVNSHLQKDVSTLKEVNEQMRRKFALHLKHLEETIRNCQAQQNDLHVLRGKESVQIPHDAGPPDVEPENIEKELNSKVEPTRIQLDQLKMQYEQTKRRIKAELIRLEDANAARQLLNEMVSEVAQSLRDAHELFQPEVVLARSEKRHRKNRLLAALFVLLSTSDLLGSRTTLRQLGISSINRSSSPPYRLPFMNRFSSPTVGTEHSCAASIAGALKIHHLVTTDLLEYEPEEHNASSCAQLTSELLRGLHQHLRHQDKPSSSVRSVTVKAVPRAETASQCHTMPALQTSTSDQYASVRLPKLRNKPRMRLQHSSRMFRIFNSPDQECLPSLYPLTVL